MSNQNQLARTTRPDYGIDAPKELRRNALYGAGGVAMGIILLALGGGAAFGLILGGGTLVSGVVLLIICAVMFWGSKVGKLRLRDQVLDALPWCGDEMVLDVGCGRGLMLIGAAKHLTTGKATGVDMFRQVDQANNSPEATMRNAVLEGVADRVEVRRGDMHDLPFAPNTFDLVLSSWVIHNMPERDDREKALREIMRVLKPGGRALIVDIEHIDDYRRYLRDNGVREVTKSRANYLFVTPTHALTIIKPGA
jgi:SAM-dependent methyltransferase